MTTTRAPRANPRRRKPIWTTREFTCPRCLRSFAAGAIRIIKHGGRWHCHACANALTGQVPAREHDIGTCANCLAPITGDRTVNTAGYPIHRNCPAHN